MSTLFMQHVIQNNHNNQSAGQAYDTEPKQVETVDEVTGRFEDCLLHIAYLLQHTVCTTYCTLTISMPSVYTVVHRQVIQNVFHKNQQ